MLRFLLLFVVSAGLLAACSPPAPSNAQTGAAGSTAGDANALRVQLSPTSDISVEKILGDIVGKQVSVPNASGEFQPLDWTFASDEPKRAQILERKVEGRSAFLVVEMYTTGAPGADDEDVQLFGKLRLDYEWNGRNWRLLRIENMTFRHSQRLFI